MKKRIALWLVALARKIAHERTYELSEYYEPTQLGIGYHLSKKDVRQFRKSHPEYTSHRKGLDALVKDTQQIILGNIAAGLTEKGLLEFEVRKTLWTADVSGRVIVYKRKDEVQD